MKTYKLTTFLLACGLCMACTSHKPAAPLVQAHRGGAAVYPENTIEAMLHAVDLGVPVLEMDLHVTRDSQVVISHDEFLNPVKILRPDGEELAQDSPKIYIYALTYDSLRRYDAGSRPNPAYPGRQNLRCAIPRIDDLIDSVETYTRSHRLPPVGYNIEIKSTPDKDGISTPDYKTFADLCMRELLKHDLGDRLLMQCFDPRTLNYVHSRYPDVRLSYLVAGKADADFEAMMQKLDFTPQVISPYAPMVNADFMANARKDSMEVVPWTVDDKAEALRLSALGVDAIITNRPDSILVWLKQQ